MVRGEVWVWLQEGQEVAVAEAAAGVGEAEVAWGPAALPAQRLEPQPGAQVRAQEQQVQLLL